MSAKVKTVTLEFPVFNMDRNFVPTPENKDDHQVYRIVKVTDSVDYSPGQTLLKHEVKTLAEMADWKVTVVPSTRR